MHAARWRTHRSSCTTAPQVNLADRRPEALQYLGASFGVTAPLLGFWQRAGYLPVYLRQTPSEVSTARTAGHLSPEALTLDPDPGP